MTSYQVHIPKRGELVEHLWPTPTATDDYKDEPVAAAITLKVVPGMKPVWFHIIPGTILRSFYRTTYRYYPYIARYIPVCMYPIENGMTYM